MIAVFNLNPTLDILTCINSHLKPGVSRTREITAYYGGKGSNTALALAQNGVKCCLSGFMPKDEKKHLAARYKKANLLFDPVYTAGRSRPCLIIKTPSTEYVINSSVGTAPCAVSRRKILLKIKDLACVSKAVVFSGSLSHNLPETFYADCISACKNRCTVILDSSGPPLIHGVKAGPAILKINLTEAREAFNEALSSEKTVLNLMKKLCKRHGIKSVILTDGASPVRVFNANKYSTYRVPAVKKTVFTTGAGDAFTAGFCLGVEKNSGFEKCILTALKFASEKIKKPAA